jgi:hypothetical protein
LSYVTRAGRGAASLVAVLAAYGWLDLMRHLPGPHLPLVLPLRANGGADDVSLVAVVLVFAATFAAIARIAPPLPARAGRVAIVRGLLLAAFLVTTVALQQGIVEQSRPTFAWGGALSLAWPWLAAASAVLGTLLGLPRTEPAPASSPALPAEKTAPRALERTVA